MSALILPALAIGGVYLIYAGLTKKKRSSHSSSSSNKSSKKLTSKSSSSSVNKTKHHKQASSVRELRVKHNQTRKKNKEKKDNSLRKMNVFYTYGGVKGKKWSYTGLPSGWSLKKKIDVSKSKYTKGAMFTGPRKTRDEMEKYLNRAFDYLKQKNIIKYYKVTSESLN
jgi:hypothetical protein